MARAITYLHIEEPARFNPNRLERLCTELGEVRAETKVADALERIGQLLRQVENTDAHADNTRLPWLVSDLIATSDLIGMASLASVARDVATCLDRRDPVALAATLSRLRRVGDRSILAVWDLEDLSS